jgi:chromosomal replication initiation ATPase DnaA
METPSDRIDRIVLDVAARHHTNVASIRGPAKDKLTVAARRAVCLALRAEGLSSTQIAQKVNRDHTSVLSLLGFLKKNKDRQQRKQEG